VAIKVDFANLGGNPKHLELVEADFGKNYENVEERLRSSWAAFMDDPYNLQVISAELTVASSAILHQYRLDISDQMRLSRRVSFCRKQIQKLNRQKVLIQLTREKIFNSLKGGDGAKNEYMTDFDNMSNDFLKYHLKVVIEKFEDYLVKGNANVLTSDVPLKGTLSADGEPRVIDWRKKDIRWLKDVNLTEAQMDEVFVHLKGDANFVTEFVNDGTTYPIIWDGVVAYGSHMGVPNKVFFYHDDEDVSEYSLSEKFRYRKFSIGGGDWDLLQERPLVDAVLTPNPDVAIDFGKLPAWFHDIKYRMTKDYYLPARNYEGFWMNGRFSGRGTLTNTGYTKNSFVSCLLYWSNPPIAKAMRLVFGDGSVYNGGVKYVSIEMIFLMHGWGTLRPKNWKEKHSTGCWKEGALLPKVKKFNCNTLPKT